MLTQARTFTAAVVLLMPIVLSSACDRSAAKSPDSVGLAPAPAPAAPMAAGPAPNPTLTSAPGDAPQISRSVGVEGGFVVLWPRVVGSPQSPNVPSSIARDVQTHLTQLVTRVAAGKPVDVRPEPERVCPRSGCVATSVGVMLAYSAGGCAAVALVSDKGPSPQELVPWAGTLELKASSVPFREPPEAVVGVQDFVPCADLLKGLQDKDVEAAIQRKIH